MTQRSFAGFSILIAFAVGLAACQNSDSSSNGAQSNTVGSFEGTWMADDILEFKQTKNESIICDNIENDKYTGHQDELRIDGQIVDASGAVFDLQFRKANLRSDVPIWKVQADGTTTDNLMFDQKNNEDCVGCENLLGLQMKIIDANTIANLWSFKGQNNQKVESEVKYHRMSDEEMKTIQTIFKNCPKPSKD